MTYLVKEIFYSLQGEGVRTGRAAVFCRFVGCNLWSGREIDRVSARCNFCDTHFLDSPDCMARRFLDPGQLADTVATVWPKKQKGHRYVICTGGEPLLQLDIPLLEAFHAHHFEIAVETNGSLPVPNEVDWICVSPKAGVALVQTHGNELKLVYPQKNADPKDFEDLPFTYFFLQPMDGPLLQYHTDLAVKYCLDHPLWRLSLQIHKYLQIS